MSTAPRVSVNLKISGLPVQMIGDDDLYFGDGGEVVFKNVNGDQVEIDVGADGEVVINLAQYANIVFPANPEDLGRHAGGCSTSGCRQEGRHGRPRT